MKKNNGFTIIELLITLALVTMLAGFALPALQDLVVNNRATTQANNFLTALTLARSEAIKRRTNVNVVATNGADGANEWGPGWQVTSGGTTIRDFEAAFGSTLNSVGDVATITFDPSGMLSAPAAGTDLTFQLRPDSCEGNMARDITMTRTGRASVSVVNCP
jgi:type IV fimbrial biogenesis protein FimT